MPDIKEKLVELLRVARLTYRQYLYEKDCLMRVAKTESEFETVMEGIETETSFVADHLVSNGVTIQQWISVEKRLPERGVKVLCYMNFLKSEETKEWGVCVTENTYNGMFIGSGFRKAVWEWQSDFVTHWMPLPQPPKGE